MDTEKELHALEEASVACINELLNELKNLNRSILVGKESRAIEIHEAYVKGWNACFSEYNPIIEGWKQLLVDAGKEIPWPKKEDEKTGDI